MALIEATLERGKANGWPLNTQSLFSMLDKSNGWPLAANILQDLESLERFAHYSGRTDLAVSIASDVRTQMSKVSEAPKYLPARCEYSLGYYLSLQQKPEDAEQHLREALRLQLEHDPNLPDAAKTRLQLGIVLLKLKNYADAEPLLIKYHEDVKEQDKDIASGGESRIPEAIDRLIELYTATGNSDEVEKYRLQRADFPSDVTPPPKEQK